ncbi:MAG: hypothetical protein OM95_13720 [Bdellovibrio sp. ArHS]|uniref:UDP-glucose 4-epimerase GalE n=1 Tax=Bdellovibrio sp. ArHS TaxID=1569284 RepID=UPI000582953C|nr:UDP-glucose 4-epimerase GalE [Bdellovibrio sp. ArHS]KHD87635.1 MAG: hypothetical protein OM95_13720 [Bdellovibrio sp. ArHS]
MRVLVTGGAGYIGSHVVRQLIEEGHQVLVLDDLSEGHLKALHADALFIPGSTAHGELLSRTFNEYKIEAVMHFAANIEVAESVENPYKYYHNNVANTLTLLNAMHEAHVEKLVFSSTAAVYGEPQDIPVEEHHPRQPVNPYGKSKMMVEMILEDFAQAHGLQYAVLRYFNVAGAAPDGSMGEDHMHETHLIPRILKSALQAQPEVKIFGADYPTPDGTCIRDYVHVMDLAKAHTLALRSLRPGNNDIYNIGSEKGFSVREILRACERATQVEFIVKEERRRPGDPAVLVASSQKIQNKLGWQRMYPHIDTIITHAWNWHRTHPQGYSEKRADYQTQYQQI